MGRKARQLRQIVAKKELPDQSYLTNVPSMRGFDATILADGRIMAEGPDGLVAYIDNRTLEYGKESRIINAEEYAGLLDKYDKYIVEATRQGDVIAAEMQKMAKESFSKHWMTNRALGIGEFVVGGPVKITTNCSLFL